jgi:DNA-binding transcriptional MerR regulator
MKNESVKGFLTMSGLKIDNQTLIYWEKEGLLGEVVRIGDKKDRRDYSPTNICRIVLTIVLRNAGWKIPDIKLVFSKDTAMLDNANITFDRIKGGLISAIDNARRYL